MVASSLDGFMMLLHLRSYVVFILGRAARSGDYVFVLGAVGLVGVGVLLGTGSSCHLEGL